MSVPVTNAENPEPTVAPPMTDKPSDVELSDELKQKYSKLARQVEFYFSDINLPSDKFLFQTSQSSLPAAERLERPGTGFVPLTTILSFKRMRKYQDLGLKKVATAVRTYASDLLEVDSTDTKVRRSRPIVKQSPADQVARSVYVKGFPTEEEYASAHSESLQEGIEEWLGEWGPINQVRMRREGGNEPEQPGEEKRKFKGSVFAEFSTRDLAEKFVALDPKPTFPGQTVPIETLWKQDYMEMKAKEKGIDLNNPAERNKDQTKRPANKFNAFHELKEESKKAGKSGKSGKGNTAPEDVPTSITYSGSKVDITPEGTLADPSKFEYKKQTVLTFTNAGKGKFEFSAIKTGLKDIAPTAFVHYEPSEDERGFVTFREPVTDDKLKSIEELGLKAADGPEPLKWTRLSDEEEREFHLKRAAMFASQAVQPSSSSGGRSQRGGRGGGRGGRGGGRGRGNGRKRGRDDDGGDSAAKKPRTRD